MKNNKLPQAVPSAIKCAGIIIIIIKNVIVPTRIMQNMYTGRKYYNFVGVIRVRII